VRPLRMRTVPEIQEIPPLVPRRFTVFNTAGVLIGYIIQVDYHSPFHYQQVMYNGKTQYHGVVIMRYIVEQMEKANRLLNADTPTYVHGLD